MISSFSRGSATAPFFGGMDSLLEWVKEDYNGELLYYIHVPPHYAISNSTWNHRPRRGRTTSICLSSRDDSPGRGGTILTRRSILPAIWRRTGRWIFPSGAHKISEP